MNIHVGSIFIISSGVDENIYEFVTPLTGRTQPGHESRIGSHATSEKTLDLRHVPITNAMGKRAVQEIKVCTRGK